MAINFQQTATTTGMDAPAAMCSGATLAGTTYQRQIVLNGTPAPSETSGISIIKGFTRAIIFFETPASSPGLTDWASGNYVVRINITSTDGSSMTWNATYICRVNSSGVNQATVGSLTGQTTSMSTTGVKTHTVSGAQQTANSGDRIYIVTTMIANGTDNGVIGITFNQLIDTPLVTPSATITPYKANDMLLLGLGRNV